MRVLKVKFFSKNDVILPILVPKTTQTWCKKCTPPRSRVRADRNAPGTKMCVQLCTCTCTNALALASRSFQKITPQDACTLIPKIKNFEY